MKTTGKLVTFFADTRSGLVEVCGEEVDFGLVLHPAFGDGPVTSPANGWTISDPLSGLSVVVGADRVDVANLLALAIAHFGGADQFHSAVVSARGEALMRRVADERRAGGTLQ